MPKRKVLSKGKRFDIFRRDGFTCHYCGRQPPEAVLQVDHITPVVKGGTNDPMNLITACRDCNLGKSKKILSNIHTPDADLAWLELQQETAELRAYQASKNERDRLIAEIVKSLQQTWFDHSGLDWCPSEQVVRQFLSRYSPEIVEQAIMIVAPKEASGYTKGAKGWLRYIWGVIRKMGEEK